jgi:hypothetical protein
MNAMDEVRAPSSHRRAGGRRRGGRGRRLRHDNNAYPSGPMLTGANRTALPTVSEDRIQSTRNALSRLCETTTILSRMPQPTASPTLPLKNVTKLSIRGHPDGINYTVIAYTAPGRGVSLTVTGEEVPQVVQCYQIKDYIALRTITFIPKVVHFMSQLNPRQWSGATLLLNDVDFRPLRPAAFTDLMEKTFAVKAIQFTGLCGLPCGLSLLHEFRECTFLCCRFDGRSREIARAKVTTEEIAQWLHTREGPSRFLSLSYKQIDGDVEVLADKMRRASEDESNTSSYLFDVYLAHVPKSFERGRAVHRVEHTNDIRFSIRYDYANRRLTFRRYPAVMSAKSFEASLRRGVEARYDRSQRSSSTSSSTGKTSVATDFDKKVNSQPSALSVTKQTDEVVACECIQSHSASSCTSTDAAGGDLNDDFYDFIVKYGGRIRDGLRKKGRAAESVEFKRKLFDLFLSYEEALME